MDHYASNRCVPITAFGTYRRLAQAVMAAGQAVRIVRWWLPCAPDPDLPLRACVRAYLAGMVVNNMMRFRAGGAVRAERIHDLPPMRAVFPS